MYIYGNKILEEIVFCLPRIINYLLNNRLRRPYRKTFEIESYLRPSCVY